MEILDKEVFFDGRQMITETDLKGKITYVNRKFIEMSGYTKEELIGKPHSIIRHPDMPECAFKSMWEDIKKNNYWAGFVKNLRKDGMYYWVKVTVCPKINDNGDKIGYIATRQPVSEINKEEFSELYKSILEGKCSSEKIKNLFRKE